MTTDNPIKKDPTEKPIQVNGQDSNNRAAVEEDTQVLVGPVRKPTDKVPLVHGLYAADIVLPWESEDEFQHLYRELKQEWLPDGRQEYETVLSLARSNWVKHRLMRSSQIAFRMDPFQAELEKAGAKTWADVSALLGKKAQEDENLVTLMRETLEELKAATKAASASMKATDKTSIEIFRSVQHMEEMYRKHNDQMYQKAFDRLYQKNPGVDSNKPGTSFSDAYSEKPRTLVEQAYHPDYLEKLVRLEAAIDARIDKLLQRLTSIKEYKRIAREARAKQISSPSIAPPTPGEI